MIIRQLVLHDFGVFGGRHEIDLAPVSADKPVVLIGALNGRGKTTTLDAINLVLFGQRARLSNREPGASWDRYLRESINSRAPGGALVGMQFSIEDDFGVRAYDIARSWEVAGRSVREYFNVSVNGEVDHVLAEDWDEHIEGLLPLEVASLNFFDGEKIDKLADPTQSRSVVESAIRGLLGLGVLERLQADVKVYLRRKQGEAIGEEASAELDGIAAEIESLAARRAGLVQERGTLVNRIERSRMLLYDIERRARALGSDKWEQRVELEQSLRDLSSQRAVLETELQALAEGTSPLFLVRDLLERTGRQMLADEAVHTASVLVAELERRDAEVLAQLEGAVAAPVREILERDRAQRRTAAAAAASVHALASQVRPLVESARGEVEGTSTAAATIGGLRDLDARINDVERRLMAVPTEDQLAPVLEELGRARAELDALAAQHDALDSEIDHITSVLERSEAAQSRMLEEEADKQKVALEERRSREYAQRALATVDELMRSTVARNLVRIEAAILARFRELIGKEGLVTGVSVDPSTLEIGVTTGDGEARPVARLSAGERQLLATAILWGLSTVAGRTIPLVIDTPLGRLDGEHRSNLIDRYFPHAAPQVVILSTDTEIIGERYERLKPAVGREYTIVFDPETAASGFRPGYL
jgi:DNA sulfur modification protein DndD